MNKSVKRIVVVLVVLVAVLVAADFGLAAAGEYQLSKKIRSQLNLASDPAVTIHGFPVILQALNGDYTDISISATGVPAKNTLRDLEVDADLHHVRVPLSELLSGNVSSAKVDEVDGQVRVKATDLGRLLKLPDLTVTPVSLDTILGVGAQQRLQPQPTNGQQVDSTMAGIDLAGTVDIAGQQTKIDAFGIISLVNGDIQITPKKLQATNSLVSGQLPDAVLAPFLKLFTVTLSGRSLQLPFSAQATGVEVDNGAVVLRGKATGIVFNAGNVSQ